MRFMMIVKGNEQSEAGTLPTEEELAEMGKYNDEMVNAGVMVAGEGLQPTSKGFKVKYDGDKRTVIDGPFAESNEIIGGFWIIEVGSREEAIEWAKKVPFRESEIEVRQVRDGGLRGERPDRRAAPSRARAAGEDRGSAEGVVGQCVSVSGRSTRRRVADVVSGRLRPGGGSLRRWTGRRIRRW